MKYLLLITLIYCQVGSYAETSKEPIPGEASSKITFLSVGPGLAVFNGSAGMAVNVGLLRALNDTNNLFFGADLGLNFWGSSGSLLSSIGGTRYNSATGIQVLPTLVYRFDLTGSGFIYPYLGVSAGPHVFVEQTSATLAGITAQETNTAVLFELLFRPGFFTHLSRTVSLNVEGKFGLLKNEFIFLPQVNAVFAL